MVSVVSTMSNEGKKIWLDRTYNDSPTREEVTKVKVGVGTTDADPTDTDIETPVPITGTESVDDCEVADWNDSADMTTSLNSTTYKEGSNSLNLTKDGGASATASTSKTTNSLDFADKEFHMWLYIKDATALAKLETLNCLVIRFGNGAGAYWEWTRDAADLAVGWNRISGLTDDNEDSSVGAPATAACDYTYIALVADAAATTWSAGDFMMDDIKLVSADDFIKSFETGYPILDYGLLQSVIRGRLNTGDANGYAISEFGIFNEDGTPKMESRDTFTALSKTDTEEFIFEAKTIID